MEPLKAKKESTCPRCNKPIHTGQLITQNPATKQYEHAMVEECTGTVEKPVAKPWPIDEAWIQANVDWAEEEAKRIFATTTLPEGAWRGIATELAAQRFSAKSSALIQNSKNANIKRVEQSRVGK